MTVGRLTFVAWLFIVSFSCFVVAATNSSTGWFAGGIAILLVAIFAKRQFKREEATEPQGVSIGFFGAAVLIVIIAMLGLFWLQFSA